MDKATLRDGRLYGLIKAEDVTAVIEALRLAKAFNVLAEDTLMRPTILGEQLRALPPYIKEMVDGVRG